MIDLELLCAYGGNVKLYRTGEIIFPEGVACHCYHQLKSGLVRWVNILENGKEYLQTLVEPGESFGELPLFDGGVYAATAIADSDCEVYRIPAGAFHQLIIDHPKVHFDFSRLLAERLRFKFMITKECAYHDPEHRIAGLITYLTIANKNICQHCFQLKLTRQQIGDMTGLRVETVIRTMRKMHENGEIVIRKGRVYLPNMTEII